MPSGIRPLGHLKIASTTMVLHAADHSIAEGQPSRYGIFRDINGDVRLAIRRLRSQPLVSGAVILTFGIAVGLATTIYSAAESVLLRPFPFRDPDRLISIWRTTPGVDFVPLPAPEFSDLRSRSTTLLDVAGFEPSGFGVQLADRTVWADTFRVTGNWFEILGIEPVLGRALERADEAPGQQNVVVLSERFWRSELGGDPRVLGTSLTVTAPGSTQRSVSLEIVGIVRDVIEFSYPTKLRPQAYVPRIITAADLVETARIRPALITIARVRSGISAANASEEVRAVLTAVGREHPAASIPSAGVRALLLHDELVGRTRPMFLLLGAAALVLLIVATTNVTAVLLAGVSSRNRDMAMHIVLGCSPARLVRTVLAEHVMLALLSAGTAILVCAWTVPALRVLAPALLPRTNEIRVGVSSVWFVLAVALAGGLAFGVAPTVAVLRQSASANVSLRTEIAVGRHKRRFTQLIVVIQTALVIALLGATASIGRGIWKLTHLDLGFDPQQVVVAQLTFGGTSEPQVLEAQIRDRLRATPGVLGVSAASELPFSSGVLVGIETATTSDGPRAVVAAIDPDYFPLLKMNARRGRLLAPGDLSNDGVVVVNETLAQLTGSGGAVGGRIKVVGEWREVIGVVQNVTEVGSLRGGVIRQAGLARLTLPAAYIPTGSGNHGNRTFLLVKTSHTAAQMEPVIRRTVHSVDTAILVRRIGTLEDRIEAPGTDARFAAAIMAAFGTAALLIASLGLYGVLMHAVRQHTRETAVRLALGATRAAVLRSTIGGTFCLVIAGLALGLAVSVQMGPLLDRWLFETRAANGLALAAAASVLLIVAAIATLAPAYKLSRIDPIAVLRME